MDDRTVGILGGGQLGRMLTEAAHRMNLKIAVLDSEDAPAKQINARHPHVHGSFTDPNAVRELARQCDILTIEIEHVNTEVLEEIAEVGVEITQEGQISRRRVEVQPNWRTIRIIQDKYLQKQHLRSLGVSTAESVALSANSVEALAEAGKSLGYPLMLKSRTLAYDGRGNFPVRSPSDMPAALKALGERPLYAEKWIEFAREIAVMIVKTENGASGRDGTTWKQNTLAYPVVETIHEDSICKLVYAPSLHTSSVSAKCTREAEIIARKAVAGFWGRGVFGVELFLTDEGEQKTHPHNPKPYAHSFNGV
jgi:phosphoribosylaminoimidazole carboxylase